MLTSNTLQELLHRADLAVSIRVLAIRNTNADQRQVVWRAHGDAPDPITPAKEMMSREVRNEGAVLLLDSANTVQNSGIEIRQPEPEYVLLFMDRLVKLQQLGEDAATSGGVNQPAGTKFGSLLGGVFHGPPVATA